MPGAWRQAVWLAVPIACLYAAATAGDGTGHGPAETVSRVSAAAVPGIAGFWWGLRFLAGSRVSYLAALPEAVVTVAFLAGLRAFSALAFQPLIVSDTVTYGPLGTVLVAQWWLTGVGWVVYGGQLSGRWIHDAWLRAREGDRRGRGQPDGREQGHDRPGGEQSQPAHGDPGTPPQ
jgi:membrane protein